MLAKMVSLARAMAILQIFGGAEPHGGLMNVKEKAGG